MKYAISASQKNVARLQHSEFPSFFPIKTEFINNISLDCLTLSKSLSFSKKKNNFILFTYCAAFRNRY